jgi:hypothetical protein
VHRIILHQNLFLSFLLNGILVILFKTIVMLNELQSTAHNSLIEEVRKGEGPSIGKALMNATCYCVQNSVGCRVLLVLTKYSRMTNYMWMFCEGFYLHRLIAAAFAEQKSLLIFYLIGWGKWRWNFGVLGVKCGCGL